MWNLDNFKQFFISISTNSKICRFPSSILVPQPDLMGIPPWNGWFGLRIPTGTIYPKIGAIRGKFNLENEEENHTSTLLTVKNFGSNDWELIRKCYLIFTASGCQIPRSILNSLTTPHLHKTRVGQTLPPAQI